MNFFIELFQNKVFLISAISWAVAQFLKTMINLAFTRKFDPERLFGSGGMPSSHSSTVCALATACALQYGASSFEFAISAIMAIIVMYDARGVRRETGTQAVVINQMMEYFKTELSAQHKIVFDQEKLKELVGHTPLQVCAGALLGILLAVIFYPML